MGSGGDSSDTGAVFNLLRVLDDPGGYKSKLAEFDKRRDAAQQAEAAAAGPMPLDIMCRLRPAECQS